MDKQGWADRTLLHSSTNKRIQSTESYNTKKHIIRKQKKTHERKINTRQKQWKKHKKNTTEYFQKNIQKKYLRCGLFFHQKNIQKKYQRCGLSSCGLFISTSCGGNCCGLFVVEEFDVEKSVVEDCSCGRLFLWNSYCGIMQLFVDLLSMLEHNCENKSILQFIIQINNS